MTIPNRLDN